MKVSSRFTCLSVEVAHCDFEVEIATTRDSDTDSFFCDETIESPNSDKSVAKHQVIRVRRHSKFPITAATKRPRCTSDESSSSA